MKPNTKTKTIDLGNYNIKLCDDIEFVTTFEKLDTVDTTETNILHFDGKMYAMEKNAQFDSEFNKAKKSYLPNLLWGLDKMGAEDGDKYSLILGLPIESLGQSEELKKNLEGKNFTYTTKDIEKTITIERVGVVGEGISSYYMLSKEDREKDTIIIDLGGRTVNVAEFRNKKLHEKATYPIGMINFFDDVKYKFNNTEGQNIETYDVYHYMENKVIGTDIELEDMFINKVMERLKLKFNIGLGKQIVFTGGGSITLKAAIERYNKDFKFMDNPMYTNVKGNMKIAKAKGWC